VSPRFGVVLFKGVPFKEACSSDGDRHYFGITGCALRALLMAARLEPILRDGVDCSHSGVHRRRDGRGYLAAKPSTSPMDTASASGQPYLTRWIT
jgi:hypothetical protein